MSSHKPMTVLSILLINLLSYTSIKALQDKCISFLLKLGSYLTRNSRQTTETEQFVVVCLLLSFVSLQQKSRTVLYTASASCGYLES